jgi:hypothetical protein
MAQWEVTVNGVRRELWDNTYQITVDDVTTTGAVQYYNGDGEPNGEPQPISTEQLDRLNTLIERRELLASAISAHQANEAYLAKNPPTTAEALAQVRTLTQHVNALIKIVGQDVLNLDGRRGSIRP